MFITRQELYHEYLKSPEWEALKNIFYKKYGKYCCICKSTNNLNVHHRIYRKTFQDTVVEDLACVCAEHHQLIHDTEEGEKWKRILERCLKSLFNKPIDKRTFSKQVCEAEKRFRRIRAAQQLIEKKHEKELNYVLIK